MNKENLSIAEEEELLRQKEELIEKHIEDIDIAFVIDSAQNGALEEIERQLIADNCPDDIFQIVKDEVFVNRIIIDRA